MSEKLEKITLKTPILINGKEVKELTYNTDEITCEMFAQAFDARAQDKTVTVVQEFDSVLFMNLGFFAVIAVNPDIDITDLKRIKGADVMSFVRVGRAFIFGQGTESAVTAEA